MSGTPFRTVPVCELPEDASLSPKKIILNSWEGPNGKDPQDMVSQLSVNKQFLSSSFAPSTVLGAGDAVVKKTNTLALK